VVKVGGLCPPRFRTRWFSVKAFARGGDHHAVSQPVHSAPPRHSGNHVGLVGRGTRLVLLECGFVFLALRHYSADACLVFVCLSLWSRFWFRPLPHLSARLGLSRTATLFEPQRPWCTAVGGSRGTIQYQTQAVSI